MIKALKVYFGLYSRMIRVGPLHIVIGDKRSEEMTEGSNKRTTRCTWIHLSCAVAQRVLSAQDYQMTFNRW